MDFVLLDDTPIEADLSYIDQNKKFVFAGMNIWQMSVRSADYCLNKTDSETKEALEGSSIQLICEEISWTRWQDDS